MADRLTAAQLRADRPHHQLITCAHCGAPPNQPCTTSSGHPARQAHLVRWEGTRTWWAGWNAHRQDHTC